MKDVFPEFYRPSDAEAGDLVTSAKIVLDANVLLNLYRLRLAERNQVLDVLDSVRDRLWLPYQAGLEYHRNRLTVILTQAGKLRSLGAIHGVRSLEDMRAKLRGLGFTGEMHEMIDALLPDLDNQLKSALKKFEKEVDRLAAENAISARRAVTNDPVRDRLDALFVGKVGKQPDSDKYLEWVKEGVRRVAERVPPGYMDVEKTDDESKAGDFLVWAQILEFAETVDSPILFITNDRKEDWFERIDGEIAGPRIELVVEFGKRSAKGYHQVTLAEFLVLAKTHLTAQVDSATIDEVSESNRDEGPISVDASVLDELQRYLAAPISTGMAPEDLAILNMALRPGGYKDLRGRLAKAVEAAERQRQVIPASAREAMGMRTQDLRYQIAELDASIAAAREEARRRRSLLRASEVAMADAEAAWETARRQLDVAEASEAATSMGGAAVAQEDARRRRELLRASEAAMDRAAMAREEARRQQQLLRTSEAAMDKANVARAEARRELDALNSSEWAQQAARFDELDRRLNLLKRLEQVLHGASPDPSTKVELPAEAIGDQAEASDG